MGFTITGGMNFSGGFSIQAPAASVSDEYFEYTTLLLPGNGSNGGTNNTFLDSSTNNFTITRNGNTTQGTFSPFSQTGWGNYFNGSSYLSIPDNTALDLGAGDFTIEAWIFNQSSTGREIISKDQADASVYQPTWRAFRFYINSSGGITLLLFDSSNIATIATSGITLALNTWYHVAAVRNSGTVQIFVNGISYASVSNSTVINNTAYPVRIGVDGYGLTDPPAYYFTGYISNVRIVKGTAVYTSNFTPSTSPLTAVSGTSLLTCQNNRIIDNSTNNFTITVNGTVTVQAFSPFNPTSSYSSATNGGSGYFDGNGDYLRCDQALDAFTSTSQAFTMEAWFYATVTPTTESITILAHNSSNDSNQLMCLLTTTAGTMQVIYNGNAGVNYANSYVLNQWNHIALVYSGTNLTFYVNGISKGTQSGTLSAAPSAGKFAIGAESDATDSWGNFFTGYISDVRVASGNVYTSNFTPPTAPLTAINGTSFLCNFTNGQVVDATSTLILETGGNTSISTAQSKFGGSSIYFDGVSDQLLIKSSPVLNFGGDFTIEFWVYLNTLEDNMRLFNRQIFTSSPNIELQTRANGALAARLNSTADPLTTVSAAGVLTTGAWYHIAFVRSGTATNNVNVYVNGVSVIAFTNTAACNPSADFYIANYPGLDRTPDCYMNDFRITNGYARYTSNFTPPTTAFPTF